MDAVPRKKARLETARKSSEALNTAADEAAGGCMARRLRNSSRLEWANRVQNNTVGGQGDGGCCYHRDRLPRLS